MLKQITDPAQKMRIAREILESLKDWFEVDESRERYIAESAEQIFLAEEDASGAFTGFLCLKETGRDTAEIAVMGVLQAHQREGIGSRLVARAKDAARAAGYSFLQVKTVQMGVYPEYDCTNRFYLRCGFCEFEVFPELWDAANPCQVYVTALK